MSKRILVVYYSQTGEVQRVVDSLVGPLIEAGHSVHLRQVEADRPYPFPWSFGAFLDAFPDCLNGDAPTVRIAGGDVGGPYDLVVLAYQVWFLSPSLPIQGFLSSSHSEILRDAPVVTLTVCRNMWHNGFLKLRAKLDSLGAHLIDNVVVTHQGPAWSTFITTVRSLLTGSKDKVLGLPSASVGEDRIRDIERYGERIASKMENPGWNSSESMLRGCAAVQIDRHYLVPEMIGGPAFKAWAKGAKAIGRRSALGRRLFLYLFILTLALGIVTVIPLTILVLKLFPAPFRGPLEERIALLLEPSGA